MSAATSSALPTVSLPLLQSVRIASPCPMRWDDLTPIGASHTRHCNRCDLNVHNLSGMTAADAEALLRSATNDDGTAKHRLCVGFYQRADGTVMTADCPVGLAALRAKARRTVARIAAVIGLTTLVSWGASHESNNLPFAQAQPLTALATFLRGEPTMPSVSTSTAFMPMGSALDSRPAPFTPPPNWLEQSPLMQVTKGVQP